MFRALALTLLAAIVYAGVKTYLNFKKNHAKAERTGFTHIQSPLIPVTNTKTLLGDLLVPICRRTPIIRDSEWLKIADRNSSWKYPRGLHDQYGDTFVVSSQDLVYIKTSSAELINQITSRSKSDFIKPLENYKVINLFGTNLVSTEGAEWKKHKKIVGPSFSEKSNKLVFEESLRQAEGMMAFWASEEGNSEDDMRVEKMAPHTAALSLHVICAAGFGVPQLWPGQEKDFELNRRVVPGFESFAPTGVHSMTLKQSLEGMLHGIAFYIFFTPWQMKISPFKLMNRVQTAYTECLDYFAELMKVKREQIALGENDHGTMDLMGSMVRGYEEPGSNECKSLEPTTRLTKQDIMANSFVFLFAGHETSANSIHFSTLFLAIDLNSQRQMQSDIDAILADVPPSSILSKSLSYSTHMPKIYNSLVGAVMNEQLRLIPGVPNFPKTTQGDQTVVVDGVRHVIPDKTFIQINIVGANRNPRYWPHERSKVPGKEGVNDLDEFIPQRWFNKSSGAPQRNEKEEQVFDGVKNTSFDTQPLGGSTLFKPIKGANPVFAEGARACPGKRFAQVEITAVLTAVFSEYSVELDVREWASDEEIERMTEQERRELYERAREIARGKMLETDQVITLKIKENIPVRLVRRGRERFACVE